MTTLLCAYLVIITFPSSEISNIELLDLFPSTTKITPTTFNETSFSLAEPHVHNDYLTPPEINSANSMPLNKVSYFHFNVRSLAKNKHKIDKIDTFFSKSHLIL